MLVPVVREVGEHATACDERWINTKLSGMGITPLLQFGEAAAFALGGAPAEAVENLGMAVGGESKAPRDGIGHPAPAALGNVSWEAGLDRLRSRGSAGNPHQSLLVPCRPH